MFKPFLFVVFICGALMPLRASNFPELLEGSPDELKNPYKTICETPDLFYNEAAVKEMLRALLAANTVDELKAACAGKNETILELLFICKGGEVEDGKPYKTDAMLKTLGRLFWTENPAMLRRKIHNVLQEVSGVVTPANRQQVGGKHALEPGVPNRDGGFKSHYVIADLSVAAENNALARAALRIEALAGLAAGDPAYQIGKDTKRSKSRDVFLRYLTAAEKEEFEVAKKELDEYRKNRK